MRSAWHVYRRGLCNINKARGGKLMTALYVFVEFRVYLGDM